MGQAEDLRLFVVWEVMRRTKAFEEFYEKIKPEFEKKREKFINELTGIFDEPEEMISNLRENVNKSLILKFSITQEGSGILNDLIIRVMGLGKIYDNPRPVRSKEIKVSGYHVELIGMDIYKSALLNAHDKYFSKEQKTRKLNKLSAEEIENMFQAYDLIQLGTPVMEVTRKLFPEIGGNTPTYDENAKRLYEQVRRWHAMVKNLIGNY